MSGAFVDGLGRRVVLPAAPRRVVSLVPSQTELLAHLGLDEEVVGLTRYCVHPAGWRERKAIVGGTKKARTALVAPLAPDLILANKEENTREDVEALEALSPVFVTDVRDLEGALVMIRDVGALVGRLPAAERLIEEISASFEALPAFAPRRALYLIWREPLMTVGADTFIHDIMARGGLVNVFGDRSRYPALTEDEVRGARPEVILLSSEPYPFKAAHAEAISAIAPEARVLLVDGEPFSWYGSRLRQTPEALVALRQRL